MNPFSSQLTKFDDQPAHAAERHSLPLRFWQTWSVYTRIPFQLASVVLAVAIVALIIALWRSPGPTVTWQHVQERETQEIVTHQFQTGPFALQTKADNAILFERLEGSNFMVETWPAYVYFGIMLLAFSMLLAVISSLSRFWFLLGSGFVIFFIANLQLETIGVLGQVNLYPAASLIVLIVVVGLSFQYFFQSATFSIRWLVYAVVVAVAFTLLITLASIPNATYFIAVNFIPATVVAAVFLVLFTAHELVTLIVLLVSRYAKGSNGFKHFIVLSGIYIANLIAMYLSRIGFFEWDFSIHPVLLLTISAVLALWGVQRQEQQMEGFMVPGALAPLAVLALAIIAVSGIAFFYTTGQDGALETVTNVSLYAHIGFGFVFGLYVISNFAVLLKENRSVMQVLFKPKFMQFFTFRLAATIAVLGFVVVGSWRRPIYDVKGARDAALGDYYMLTGDLQMAKGYYEKSDYYAFHNHHANYVLANIHHLLQEPKKERLHYQNAAERRPTWQATINALATFNDSPLQAYAYLKEINKRQPNLGVVQNELGFAHRKLKQPDSAFLAFNRATGDNLTEHTGRLNMLAIAVETNTAINIDSLAAQLPKDDFGALTNAYSLGNILGATLARTVQPLRDTVLNVFTANYLANALLNTLEAPDTAFISHAAMLAHLPSNQSFAEDVLAAAAHAAYKSGQIKQAFKWLQEASLGSDHQGRYNNTMALWALDLDAPDVAQGYVQFAVNQNFAGALLTQAVTYAEQGRRGEAVVLFDSLRKNKELAVVAESMLRILVADKKFLNDFNDLERYAYCRYRLGYADSVEFTTVMSSITDEDMQARAILDRSRKLYRWDDVYAAINTYNLFNGIAIGDPQLIEQISRHELLLQAALGNASFLQSKKQSDWQLSPRYEAERVFYDALIAHANGDSLTAKAKLLWIAQHNSFFDLGVVAAASVSKDPKEQLQAYTILATALQVNPRSVRLLKAYIQEAKKLEFDDFVQSGLQTLQEVLPSPLYKKFVSSL